MDVTFEDVTRRLKRGAKVQFGSRVSRAPGRTQGRRLNRFDQNGGARRRPKHGSAPLQGIRRRGPG